MAEYSMTNTAPAAITPFTPGQRKGLFMFATGGEDSAAVFANVSSEASYTFETPFAGTLVALTSEATLEADIDQEQAVIPELWPDYAPIPAGVNVTVRLAVGSVGAALSTQVEFHENPESVDLSP